MNIFGSAQLISACIFSDNNSLDALFEQAKIVP